jgi:hypothetical protein
MPNAPQWSIRACLHGEKRRTLLYCMRDILLAIVRVLYHPFFSLQAVIPLAWWQGRRRLSFLRATLINKHKSNPSGTGRTCICGCHPICTPKCRKTWHESIISLLCFCFVSILHVQYMDRIHALGLGYNKICGACKPLSVKEVSRHTSIEYDTHTHSILKKLLIWANSNFKLNSCSKLTFILQQTFWDIFCSSYLQLKILKIKIACNLRKIALHREFSEWLWLILKN